MQQRSTGRVERDTHRVHAAFDHVVEAFFQAVGVNIVLILTNANRFWVNLNQFGQWVHQSSANADGSANGDVFVGKFLPGHLRRRVDRRALFAHHHNGFAQRERLNKRFRLAPSSAVSNGNSVDAVLLHQASDRLGGALFFVVGSKQIKHSIG